MLCPCTANVPRRAQELEKGRQLGGGLSNDRCDCTAWRKHAELYKDPQKFADERRRQVEPILADFHSWLQRRASQVPPETLLGKAIGYTLGQWPKLTRYLDHHAIGPDTNAVENAIRPFVVGRKNWLFSGSPRGATASATLFSIIETARANGKEPYWYLRELFDKLPTGHGKADIQCLAPFRVTKP